MSPIVPLSLFLLGNTSSKFKFQFCQARSSQEFSIFLSRQRKTQKGCSWQLTLIKMLLRTSMSNTKKFFQKTIQNFKSFISGGYEKLPKTPPCSSSFPCNCIGGTNLKFSQSYRGFNQCKSHHFSSFPRDSKRIDHDPTEKFEKRVSKKNSDLSREATSAQFNDGHHQYEYSIMKQLKANNCSTKSINGVANWDKI